MVNESRVLIFGDSTTWGAWDDEFHGWANRLQLSIEEKEEKAHPDYFFYEILNLGIGGECSREILARMEAECKARLTTEEALRWFTREKNVIIIQTGGNDARIDNGKVLVPPEEFKENLKKMLDIARKYADNIAFLNCEGPIDESKTTPADKGPGFEVSYTNESNNKHSKIIDDFCKENDVLLIDIHTSLLQTKENILEDGLHLNNKGHEIVAQVAEKALIDAGFVKI